MTMLAGIPPEAFDQHSAIVGRTGSGKTYRAKAQVERLLEERRRVCIVDPTGAWWGLRSSADGKRPGYPVIVFGGEHGDIPITEHAAQPLAELVAAGNVPCVVDLSEFMVGQRHRFMEVFADHLYRRNRLPLHLVIDEADDFAPQNPLPESRRMLERVDRIVRRGRIRGFRVMMITQRPAALHKNILTQASTLVAMRLMGPQDRKAIEAWIKDQADPDAGRAVIASLPTLRLGEGWTWAPELGVLEKSASPALRTYDSSASPEDGAAGAAPVALAQVDLSAIHASFAAFEADAKANDPGALKARIKALEKELAALKRPGARTAPDPAAIERARQEGAGEAVRRLAEEMRSRFDSLQLPVATALSTIRSAFKSMEFPLAEATSPGALPARFTQDAPKTPENDAESHRIRTVSASSAGNGSADYELTGPEKQLLQVLAWWESLGHASATRAQVCAVAGWRVTSGHIKNVAGRLHGRGLIAYPSQGSLALTEIGRAVAPEARKDMSASRAMRAILTGPQVQVFDLLLDHTTPLTRGFICRACGWEPSSGHIKNVLGSMRSLELIDYPAQGEVALAEWLR